MSHHIIIRIDVFNSHSICILKIMNSCNLLTLILKLLFDLLSIYRVNILLRGLLLDHKLIFFAISTHSTPNKSLLIRLLSITGVLLVLLLELFGILLLNLHFLLGLIRSFMWSLRILNVNLLIINHFYFGLLLIY